MYQHHHAQSEAGGLEAPTQPLNWWFLVTTIFYLDGRNLIKYFLTNFVVSDYTSVIAIKLVMHHKFLSYCMYVTGFVGFVASLRKGSFKFQFAQLCVTHMTLLLVILPGPLHRQQHSSRHVLVHSACRLGGGQRHLRLLVWYHLWKDAVDLHLAEENRRRVCWSMDLHNLLLLPFHIHLLQRELFHLSRF